MNPHSQGNPKRKWAATPSARHSIRQGAKASLSTVKDSFRRATGSRPRPARINITVKAIFLKPETQVTEPFSSHHISREYQHPYSTDAN